MKLALVTGASKGFGKSLALELAKHDYYVVGAARSEDKLISLAEETKSSYITFDGYDINSITNLANKVINLSKDYDSIDVIAAADQHEDVSIVENGKKRFTTEGDFSEEYKEKAYLLAVEGPLALYNAFKKSNLPFNFFYISSQAAGRFKNDLDFWKMGNSIYGPNKAKAEELFSQYKNVSSLRYPFLDTEMADKMYEQLKYLDPVVHQDFDLSKPLRPKEEIFLPLEPVSLDTVSFVLGNKESFDKVSGNTYSYVKTVEDFK